MNIDILNMHTLLGIADKRVFKSQPGGVGGLGCSIMGDKVFKRNL
jgi:hypothetical protein